MTAEAMSGDRERCLAAGMNDYVAKPIRVDELVAAIEAHAPTRVGEQHSGGGSVARRSRSTKRSSHDWPTAPAVTRDSSRS